MRLNIMTHPNYDVVKIYESGDEYLNDIITSIQKAQHTITIESYIFEFPNPGDRILKALKEKKEAGVQIRILIDGVGSFNYIEVIQDWSRKHSVPVHVFNPLPWKNFWRIIFFPLYIIHLIYKSEILNKRNHRKVVVIDNSIAFLGSMNFSSVHFKSTTKQPWFDLALQIKGSSVKALTHAFDLTFESLRPKTKDFWSDLQIAKRETLQLFPMSQKIRLNIHFILRFLFWRDLLFRIRNAQTRIFIMNAYFVPHRSLLSSLISAAKQGVEVIILLPSKTDVPLVKWLSPLFYRKLIKNGIQIYEMQNQILHTKSIIIDDWALIGSNNLNYRSLIHDLEVDATVSQPKNLKKLLSIWNNKILQSKKIKLKSIKKLSWMAWIRYRLALLFRYFI